MKRCLVGFTLVAMTLVTQQAMAKRMGAGTSIGRSSGQVTQRYSAPPQQQAPAPMQSAKGNAATPQTPPASGPSRWGGMLGGLAAGLGLAWLANSLGLGAGFGNVLLILLLVVAGVWLLRRFIGRPRQPAFAGAPMPGYDSKNVGNDASARPWESPTGAFEPKATRTSSSTGGSMIGAALGQTAASPLTGSQSWGVPAGFDEAGFLRACKANFVRLQAAWDAADIDGLKTLMTDELLRDIKLQLQQRQANSPDAPNVTEVVSLEATLLGIEELSQEYLASVEFSGSIKEDPQQAAAPFREVWNIVKSKHRGGWLVAGVQALT